MAKLKAQAVDSYASYASLPTPIPGVFELAVTSDTNTLYVSNGVTWIATGGGSSGQVDGGAANSIYGGTDPIDGGGA